MLPTIEEQDNKLQSLIENDYNFDEDTNKDLIHVSQLTDSLKQYAKWYAEQVIKYCAEVADTKTVYTRDYVTNAVTCEEQIVDKQSILNVINEL